MTGAVAESGIVVRGGAETISWLKVNLIAAAVSAAVAAGEPTAPAASVKGSSGKAMT